MLNVVTRRLLSLVPVLFLVTLVAFFLQVPMGGNAAFALAGLNATPGEIGRSNARSTSEPPDRAVLVLARRALHGQPGHLVRLRAPGHHRAGPLLAGDASLTIAALILIIVIGVPLGILQGMRAGSAVDKGLLGFVSVAISAPGFWVATMLVFLLAVKVKVFPALGYVPVLTVAPGVGHATSSCLHFTLALAGFGIIARFLRTGIVGVSNEDFVRALHARGLSKRRINYKHVLKNASLSTITILGLNIGFLLSGAVIVEQIFTLPGMGTYALTVDSEPGLAGRPGGRSSRLPSSSCWSTSSPTSPTATSTRRCGLS